MSKHSMENSIIFSSENLEIVSELLDEKIEILKNIKDYKKCQKEISRISNTFYKTMKKADIELFEKYNYILSKMENYSNTLLYSLGIKYGIDISKL